jgi:hypothetical protein
MKEGAFVVSGSHDHRCSRLAYGLAYISNRLFIEMNYIKNDTAIQHIGRSNVRQPMRRMRRFSVAAVPEPPRWRVAGQTLILQTSESAGVSWYHFESRQLN